MLTYQDCENLFNEALTRLKRWRKIDFLRLAPNTVLHRPILPGCPYTVVFHKTAIVQILADGRYILNSGGWRTLTTKDRINRYSPVMVYQKNFDWYLETGEDFVDGVVVGLECGWTGKGVSCG